MIWNYAARVPRICEVRSPGGESTGYEVAPGSRRAPAMFHVCYESREIAKKHYTQRFIPRGLSFGMQYLWFNEEIDILLFDKNITGKMMDDVFRDHGGFIKNVAVTLDEERSEVSSEIMSALHGDVRTVPGTNRQRLLGCPGLENVFVVLRSDIWDVAPGEEVSFHSLFTFSFGLFTTNNMLDVTMTQSPSSDRSCR